MSNRISKMSALQRYGRCKSVVKRSKKYLEEALYIKLFKDGGSQLSVRQQLNQFIKSRKRVYKWEVGDTLKKLRERKLYLPALKVCVILQFLNLIDFSVVMNFMFRNRASRCRNGSISSCNFFFLLKKNIGLDLVFS